LPSAILEGVRRTGLLIAGWAVAMVLALVLGLQAVSAISDSVASRPKASLSPGSVKAALAESTSSTGESSSSSASASSLPDASSSLSPASSSAGADEPAPHDAAPDETSSSSDASSGSTESIAPPPPEDRTYQLTGGTVGVRFENGEAHLLWATPNPGFSVESSGSSSNVDVRFRSDSHESRLKAFWNNGPQQQIEEKDT
jgi:hypothetical protein